MKVVVKKHGGNLIVVIPKAMARALHLSDGVALDISRSAGGIALRKERRRSWSEIVAQLNPSHYRRRNEELRGW